MILYSSYREHIIGVEFVNHVTAFIITVTFIRRSCQFLTDNHVAQPSLEVLSYPEITRFPRKAYDMSISPLREVKNY